MTTYDPLRDSRDTLMIAAIATLTDAGYTWNQNTTSFSEYLATALTGIGGTTVSNRTMSITQLLAGLVNELDAGPVSHLTSSYDQLLALLGGAGGSPPVVPGAPVLVWTSDSTQDDPTFDVLLDAPIVGDTIYLQLDTDIAFGSPDEYENTIDSAEATAEAVVFSSFTLLANGTWYARAKHNTSDWSNVETKTISAGTAPVNTVAPVISGNLQVGQTLSTTDGTWTGTATIVFTYQWQRGGVNIAGATASTYLLVEADAGQAITCDVTGTNGIGNSTGTSNSLTIDVHIVFLAHIEDATDQTTYSGGVWNTIPLGTAAANRKIAILADARTAGTAGAFSSVSLDGNAMTAVASTTQAAGQNKVDIAIIDKTTGTSGNFSLVYTTSQGRAGAGVWAIYGAGSSTPTSTQASNNGAGATNTLPQVIPAKGVGIAGTIFTVTSGTATWSNMTEQFDAQIETTNVNHTGAHIASNAGTSTNTVITYSGTPSTTSPALSAAWGL